MEYLIPSSKDPYWWQANFAPQIIIPSYGNLKYSRKNTIEDWMKHHKTPT